MLWVEMIYAGIIGLIIGSFLNVVDLRFRRWKYIVFSRSHCPQCHHTLAWYDLIPLISFLILRQRCRYCHEKISWQYFWVELTSGILTAAIWYKVVLINLEPWWTAAIFFIFGYILLLAAIADIKNLEVGDEIFLAALIISIIGRVFGSFNMTSVALGVIVAALPFLILVLWSKERWMGWGDVFLAVPIGLMLGFPGALTWLLLTFWSGALFGIILLLLKIKRRSDPLPLIPFMALACIIVIIFGDLIAKWYIQFGM